MLAVDVALALVVFSAPQDARPARPGQGQGPEQGQQEAQRPAIPTDKRGGRILKVSLADCLRLGDSSNVDLRLLKLQELLAREDINLADSIFEPEFFATAQWRRSESPPRNTFQPSITSTLYSGSVGLRKLVVTGGSLELAFNPQYVDQEVNSVFAFPTTFFSGDVTFTLSQPLLRGAWVDYNLADYETAKRETEARAADYERTRQTVLDAIAEAYYNVIFAREDWVVRYQSLELSREQLRNTEKKIELGELAPRDRVADQADVAKKEEELITAERVILDAEDELRRLISPFRDGDAWEVILVPTDQLGEQDPALTVPSLDEAYRLARANRPDLVAGGKRVEAAQQQLVRTERDLLPGLDFTAIYSASAQTDDGGDFQRDLVQGEFPAYTLRLGLSLPIGNLAAKSAHRKARLEVESAQRSLQILEIDIQKDVRSVLRDLDELQKVIAAARESVRLARSNLEAEQIKLRLGSQSPFEVQRRNQELQDARSRLVRARLDYRITWFHKLSVLGEIDASSRLPEVEKEETGEKREG